MTCHSIKGDDGHWHHIPGCAGCASDGHRACSCPDRAIRYLDTPRLIERIADLEIELATGREVLERRRAETARLLAKR